MDKGKELSESSRSFKTYNFDPNIYTKYLNICEGTFHSLGSGVLIHRKRDAFDVGKTGDYNKVNQTKLPKRVRTLNDRVFSSALKNSEMFRAGFLYPVVDAKFRALSSAGRMYRYPSPSKVLNDDSRELDLPFPEQNTPGVHCRMPTTLEDFGLVRTKYGGLYEEEFTLKTKTEFSVGERERNFKRASDSKEPRDLNSNEPAGKKTKDWTQEFNGVSKNDDERVSYWERRRRNNASAKKSRDARRAREIQTQFKVDFLEKENTRMLAELLAIQHENLCLRRVLGIEI